MMHIMELGKMLGIDDIMALLKEHGESKEKAKISNPMDTYKGGYYGAISIRDLG